MIRVKLASIFVDDQAKALEFYTNILGFAKKKTSQLVSIGGLASVKPMKILNWY